MAQEKGNIDAIIEQIVCTALLGDKEYQKTEDKSQRRFLYDQQTEMVNESINQMCKIIESKLPDGINLPVGIRLEVANQMLVEVSQNPTAVANGVHIDEQSIMKSLDLPIRDDERDQDNIKEYYSQDMNENKLNDVKTEEMLMLEQFAKMREEMQNDIFKHAWGENGTQEDKNTAVASMELDFLEQLILNGVSYEELDIHTQYFVLSAYTTLEKAGYSERLKSYKEALGISDEDIKQNKIEEYVYEENASSEEEAIINKKVNQGAVIISTYIKYGDKNPDKIDKMSANVENSIEDMEFPVDSLIVALSQVEEKDNVRARKMIEHLENKLMDSSVNFEFEPYTLAAALLITNGLQKTNPEIAKTMLDACNKRLREQKCPEILYEEFENVCQLKDEHGNYIIEQIEIIARDKKYDESDLSIFVSDIKDGKIENKPKPSRQSQNVFFDYANNKEEENEYKAAQKRNLIEMKKTFDLPLALGLIHNGIFGNESLERNAALWEQLMSEEFEIQKIKSGESIIGIGDSKHIEEFLHDVRGQQFFEETDRVEERIKKQRYLWDLKKVALKVKLLEIKEKDGLLQALDFGYGCITDSETTKEDRVLGLQVMKELYDSNNVKDGKSIINLGDIDVVKTHLQGIPVGTKNEMQQQYLLHSSDQLKLMIECKRNEAIIGASNVQTTDLIRNLVSNVNIFDDKKHSQTHLYQYNNAQSVNNKSWKYAYEDNEEPDAR